MNVPVAGPDYTGISGGTYNNYRWVTFNAGVVNNNANVQVTFTNSTGFTSTILSNFALLVNVFGGGGTNGWVDGNAAYSGVGNPNNNGDAALVVANSNSTMKMVTFGTSVKTGVLYVRVGIPVGNVKKFGNITIVAS